MADQGSELSPQFETTYTGCTPLDICMMMTMISVMMMVMMIMMVMIMLMINRINIYMNSPKTFVVNGFFQEDT